MTTIAYKDGVIAYDSRVTRGSLIDTDNCDKRLAIPNGWLFACGASDVAEQVANRWHKPHTLTTEGFSGFAWESGVLYYVWTDEEKGLCKCVQPKDEPGATGSGQEIALTAMDYGASAKQAVQHAAKRDCKTGGKIRTFKCQ